MNRKYLVSVVGGLALLSAGFFCGYKKGLEVSHNMHTIRKNDITYIWASDIAGDSNRSIKDMELYRLLKNGKYEEAESFLIGVIKKDYLILELNKFIPESVSENDREKFVKQIENQQEEIEKFLDMYLNE